MADSRIACSNHRIVADAGAVFSKKAQAFPAVFITSDKKYAAARCNVCLRSTAWPADNHFLLGSGQRAKPVTDTRLLSASSGHGNNRQSPVRRNDIGMAENCYAACGVTAEVLMVRSLSLVALVVMLGYPPYFIIKRQLKSDAFFSVIAENLFLIISAVVLLIYQGSGNEWLSTGGWHTVTGLGLLSCSALLCFLLASSSLSFTLFGMLSYVEPLLLSLVSLFLPEEKLTLSSLLAYVPIWLAVLALMDGYRKVKFTAYRSG